MARVIAICNAKGGVGKTTTAVNVGAYLAASGKRVLLVDFDPQANASSALGYDVAKDAPSIYHGIWGVAEPASLVRFSAVEGLHFVPASPHLAGALVELVTVPNREYLLRNVVNALRHRYDYVFVDLPPSLSLLTVNGLTASDAVLIPVQAEYYSLEGLGQLLATVRLVRENLGHRLEILGALLTMHDAREELNRQVAKELRTHFPHRVLRTEIPRNAALAEAPSFGKPVMLHRPDSAGARAYERLAQELLQLEKPATPIVASAAFGNFNV